MTDFRALCAELLSALESEGYAHWVNGPDEDDLCLRARAALADKSADTDQVLNLAAIIREVDGNNSKGAAALAELILEHPGFRAQIAPTPVPVGERLPGPEDCDVEHYCWRWNTIGGLWARQPLARRWYDFESHWLPAHALPMPEVSNG